MSTPAGGGMAGEVVFRQLVCRGLECGALFVICRSCYRGQAYCSERCRQKGRRQRRREANRRHQQTREGRLDHRDRQRAYRQRRREGRVTDTTSRTRRCSAKNILQRKLQRLAAEPDSRREEDDHEGIVQVEPVCIVCGRHVAFIELFPERS